MNRIPTFYRQPFGLPLYWRNEETGELPEAVNAYLLNRTESTAPNLTPRQFELLRDYCRHFINAPCWERNFRGCDDGGEGLRILAKLRDRAALLVDVEDLAAWMSKCLDQALDPL